jgi:hypothetical protein
MKEEHVKKLIELGFNAKNNVYDIYLGGYNDSYFVDFEIDDNGLTFRQLQELSEYFHTNNINITGTEHEYYGEVTDSYIRVTFNKKKLDEFFYSKEETKERKAEEQKRLEKNYKANRRRQVLQEAKQLGIKASDLKG